jgi:hypothetical protein
MDSSFECDGKTVSIFTKGQQYRFPVTAVKEVSIEKNSIKGSPTQWDITLTLDPTCGYTSLFLDILHMTRNDEVEYYLVCLPALVPSG